MIIGSIILIGVAIILLKKEDKEIDYYYESLDDIFEE